MVFWIASAAGLAIAYLLGSTPTGYLAGKLLRGIDIREHGSKSTGATNVLRTLGKWPALVVLLVDERLVAVERLLRDAQALLQVGTAGERLVAVARLHHRVVALVERGADEHAQDLAHHFMQAGDLPRSLAYARRAAGDKVEILPDTIFLTLGANDVLLLRNLDDVPQVFGPTLIMPGQSFRLPFEVASTYSFACTAHASGEMRVIVEASPPRGWKTLRWRMRDWKKKIW